MWDKARNSHIFTRDNLEKSQFLIDAIAEFNLHMTLLKDFPTLCAFMSGNYTRPNNHFLSSSLIDDIIQYDTWLDECPARTDHIPIVPHLDISMGTCKEPPRPNFKAADWKEFRKVLAMKLEGLDTGEDINSEGEILSYVNKLTCSITEVIDTCIPKSGPVPYQKLWWSQELVVRCT